MTDKFLPENYDIFCGMDVDKRSINARFLDWQNGIKQIRTPYAAEHLLRFAEKHFPGKRIAYVYEAGPTGYGLYDQFTAAGQKCLIATPSMIPSAPGERVKTNRLDATKLAVNLRAGVNLPLGGLKVIHVPSRIYRDLRHLTHWRDICVKRIGASQRQIKSLLLMEGIAFPGKGWNSTTLAAIKELPCGENVPFELEQLVDCLSFDRKKLLEAQRQTRKYVGSQEELRRCQQYLMSITAIGPITANQFLARVGDWREMETARQTCGFLGLGARENSTGDQIRRGSITAIGDRSLRGKIIQCAWKAIRLDPQLKLTYHIVYNSNPREYASKKAIVTVARKLVVRMHAVLKNQRFFEKTVAFKQEEAVSPWQTRHAPRAKEPAGSGGSIL